VVWATTSGELDDVWLRSGQEYVVQNPGLTVIESTTRSTVEVLPPAANDAWQPGASLASFRLPSWLDDTGTMAFLAAAAGFVVLVAMAFR